MRVFISYSHQDKAALERLRVHLKNLVREGHIKLWYDRGILAGSELDAEIGRELEAADLFLLMVSPDFIASDYCVKREMKRALERHADGNVRVVPIIVRKCDWEAMNELRQLKAVPTDGKAISEWADSDAAYVDVVLELRRIIETENVPAPAGKTAPEPSVTSYVSPAVAGEVAFDYSNNNGRYFLGADDMLFETAWSRSGPTSVHAYSDPPSIRSLALATGVLKISEIKDARLFDTSSRARNPHLNEIVVWQNTAGYFLATQIYSIKSRGNGASVDEIVFGYLIMPNKGFNFTEVRPESDGLWQAKVTKPDRTQEGANNREKSQSYQVDGPILGWLNEAKSSEELSGFERLMYTSGIDKFLGRIEELDLLDCFAGDPFLRGRITNFRWMLLTGDTGVGKTRLAYEFTRKRLDDQWYKGKLDFPSLEAFDNPSKWRPIQPTFIVIDYVQSVPEKVHNLLLEFSTHAAEYESPVRLLLLERNVNAIWTDRLLPVSSDKVIIMDHKFGERDVLGKEISPLSSNAIVELMESRIQRAHPNAPEPSRLLSLANSVDHREPSRKVKDRTELTPTPRPLFAIATADAIIHAMEEGEELPKYFEREKVLSNIIKRDRDMIWSKHIKDEGKRLRYEMGLAVATLAQGVSLHDLNDVNFGEGTAWLPPLPPDHDSALLATFGYSNERWPPMEPDILGEYFVSEQLLNSSLTRDHRIALIEGALLLGGGQAVITFSRIALDFPKRFKQLQLKDVASATMNERVLLCLTGIVIYTTGPDSNFGIALGIFDAVLGREDWKKSRKLGIIVAKAAVNISTNAVKAGDWGRVDDMLARFDALRATFPQDQEIALAEAKAAFNIANNAVKAGDWGRVDDMLVRFDALRTAFQQDQEIALAEAKAAVNISTNAVKAGDWGRVDDMLARFDALRAAFPQDQEIALVEAKAAFNISNNAVKAGDWGRVDDMLVRFDALRTAFQQDQEIALAEAKAAVNISTNAVKAGDWGRVDDMLARFDALRAAFQQDQEIALAEAKAAFNISNNAIKAGDWGRVDDMLVRFDALRTAFQQDQEIALAEAKAAVNISTNAVKAGDWGRVDDMLARFDALRAAFPQDQEIALAEAKAAFNISNNAIKAGDWGRVDDMLVRFDALRTAFPQDQEIALTEAEAAVNISNNAVKAGDWGRVDDMLVRFDALRTAFQQDQEIALEEAKAAFNISNNAVKAGDWGRVDDMLARIDALRPYQKKVCK